MKKWIKRSFKNRVFVTVLLVTLLPMLACELVMMRALITKNETAAVEQAGVELNAALERFDAYLNNIETISGNLSDSTVVRSTLRRGVDDSKILYQVLYKWTEELRPYARFAVYNVDGRCLYDTVSGESGEHLDPGWGILFCAGRTNGIAVQSTAERGLICANAVRTHEGKILGYVAAVTEQTGFDLLFSDIIAPSNDLLIMDGTWRGIYYTQASRAEALAKELRAQLMDEKTLTGGEEECRFTVLCDEAKGISFILQQPKTYTATVMTGVYSVGLTTGFLSLLLCVWCAWMLSRYLSEPIKKLDEAMGRVEKGDYSVELENLSEDELGRLTASFNRMATEYRDNLARSVQRERQLNETQLSMLQAQLNPHFLYNTLDCIKWMGVTNHAPQIAEMTTDLAALLRAGISGDKLITLEQELELIGRYIEIQEIRFGDRFTCEIDVEERFQHCILPKLILQPLVENSIIHGVADMDNGYIKLSAGEENGDLLLTVSDNGRGLPAQVLDIINSPDKRIPGGHLGLNNVDRIVRLYYGESYGISAAEKSEGGASIVLRLPMQTKWPQG